MLGAMGVSLVLALLLFALVVSQLKRIHVPAGAGFMETLRYTPLTVVVLIDLLYYALDFIVVMTLRYI